MEKTSGFYVSNIHFITMVLPYIREQIKKGVIIKTYFENNLTNEINKILDNIIMDEKNKKEILDLNWKEKRLTKLNIRKEAKELLNESKKIIIIAGNKKYVKETNRKLSIILEENNTTNIKIINCYEVSEFDDNINDILDESKYILNTSGIHKKEDVFEKYKNKVTK